MKDNELVLYNQHELGESFVYADERTDYYVASAMIRLKEMNVHYPSIPEIIDEIKEFMAYEEYCGSCPEYASWELEIPSDICEECPKYKEVEVHYFSISFLDGIENSREYLCVNNDPDNCPYRKELYESWEDFLNEELLNEQFLKRYLISEKIPFSTYNGMESIVVMNPQKSLWEVKV